MPVVARLFNTIVMKKLIILYISLVCILPLLAQTERELTVTEIRQQTSVAEPITLQKGYFKVSTALSYVSLAGDWYNNDWEKTPSYSFQSKDFTFPFTFSYGVTNNFQFNISSGYQYSKATHKKEAIDYIGGYSKNINITNNAIGITDIYLGCIYKLMEQNGSLPTIAVGLSLDMPLPGRKPSVDANTYTVDDVPGPQSSAVGIEFYAKKIFYPFALTCDVSYTYRLSTDVYPFLDVFDLTTTKVKPGDLFMANIGFQNMLCDWITLKNEVVYNYIPAAKYDNSLFGYLEIPSVAFSWNPALVFQIRNFRFSQSVTFPFYGKNTGTNPTYAVNVGVKF